MRGRWTKIIPTLSAPGADKKVMKEQVFDMEIFIKVDEFLDEELCPPEGVELFSKLLECGIIEQSDASDSVDFDKHTWKSFATGPIMSNAFIYVKNSDRGAYFTPNIGLHCNYLQTSTTSLVEKRKLDGKKYTVGKYTDIRDIISSPWEEKECLLSCFRWIARVSGTQPLNFQIFQKYHYK